MTNSYKPISCHFYDKLEELAVKKQKVKIIYLDNELTLETEDLIVDFKTKNKEEFAILSNGLIIRLDKIVEII
ncbi:hypothetical protein [Arcobacter aquimarinus]|uniref:Transcriptional antiterminator Rof n=1 Tax=Arcobacter aquimarinus TaxID=1315211 RepID=A0AAE7B4J3_9BACT|nr:hypothetical protein [Arcobacter aquimarinus]QKE27179.1 hypothetical protein AAQM_2487 [Arcobacter aquimarinus]RXI35147.1 hypothetical protein CP986_08365 [Arcobacter aquimarinus]